MIYGTNIRPLRSATCSNCLRGRENGNVILLALIVITVLAATAAHVFKNVFPRYITTVQTASWKDARLAADAGVDIAIDALNASIPDPAVALTSGSSVWSTATYGLNSVAWQILTPSGPIPLTSGTNPLAFSSGALTVPVGTGSNAVTVTPALLLDNVNLRSNYAIANTSLPTQVDVVVRAVYPDSSDLSKQWFLIRAMGTTACGTPSRLVVDRMDSSLRRVTLFSGNERTAITGIANWGAVMAISPPHATRIVEVLAKQVYAPSNAITTVNDMVLGNSSPWLVDSYNSSDPNKSDSTQPGYYPGSNSPKIANETGANIATTASGATISAQNKTVMGNASTNQGSVSGTGNIQGTISNDYNQTLTAKIRPTVTSYALHTSGAYVANSTSPSSPTYYYVNKNQSFTFSVPSGASPTSKYYATMIVDSNWNGGAVIPSNVFVTIYIQGNISINGGTDTNTGAGSSNLASHLLIYGEAPPVGTTRTFSMNGNPEIAAVFYGPNYNMSLSGNVDWYGSVTAKSYSIGGGGNGGMHYDQALAKIGGVRNFDIASYVEDVRQ